MPSATSLAEQGLKAFNSSNYAEAITLYSDALSLNPEVPDCYLKRSVAYQRTSQHELALHDAELAVTLANRRGKRELIGSAQFRRGIALYLLGRYGDASFCFSEATQRCSEKERNMLGMWKKKLEIALEKVDEDDVSREVTVTEIPIVDIPKKEKVAELQPRGAKPANKRQETILAQTPTPSSPDSAPAGVITPANKIRHEWYQTSAHIVLTLYVKGVPKDRTTVEITNQTLSISFPLPSGNDFVFDVDPLFDSVVSSECSYSILSTKVEVKLLKGTAGKKWADLEGTPRESPTEKSEPGGKAPLKAEKSLYPSSSKTGPKDWDKLANELTAKPPKKNKPEDVAADNLEYDSDYDGSDPVNHFFKKLYKDANEDTRRAMMKSYIESNGTALSTNWEEVGKGKVETSPPGRLRLLQEHDGTPLIGEQRE